MRVSNTVNEALQNFYALLASAAAKRAMADLRDDGNNPNAERWAAATEQWLIKAGARATKNYFVQPR